MLNLLMNLSPHAISTAAKILDPKLQQLVAQLQLPRPDSHKGQNGKLLIVGGSELFHAASKWSLDVASKFVDMVFYASVPGNTELVRQAKGNFWNGIVIELDEIESYAQEANCILIGPGMTRTPDTAELVTNLINRFPTKKMVIDAGALQMVSPSLLNSHHIITPHRQEMARVLSKLESPPKEAEASFDPNSAESAELELQAVSQVLPGVSILLKGATDCLVTYLEPPSLGSTDAGQPLFEAEAQSPEYWSITGGHPGMTKGGTGDVLAGLVAGLYCTQSATAAAVVGSYANKLAGELLAAEVGPFFNASDLVTAVPPALWKLYQQATGEKIA
jgi:NAD(P)H-hydrate repair Nnr-like enzyme with NAD(P)H-hydrate dehydratase domain